jgi:ceramide glucosyltransferase
MALRARTLAEIGGFPAILNELADDNVLGRLVRASGHRIGLAATIPATTVPETSFAAIIRHELRWARTIRALEPAAFLFSCIQYPLAWALAAIVLSGGHPWACAVAVGALLIRAAAAEGVEAELARRQHLPAIPVRTLLLPLRDLISIGIWVAAFTGNRVEWRGRTMRARPAQAHFGVPATAATEGSD